MKIDLGHVSTQLCFWNVSASTPTRTKYMFHLENLSCLVALGERKVRWLELTKMAGQVWFPALEWAASHTHGREMPLPAPHLHPTLTVSRQIIPLNSLFIAVSSLRPCRSIVHTTYFLVSLIDSVEIGEKRHAERVRAVQCDAGDEQCLNAERLHVASINPVLPKQQWCKCWQVECKCGRRFSPSLRSTANCFRNRHDLNTYRLGGFTLQQQFTS